MKKLFFSAIPICLVSFILFGITTAVMGTKSRSNHYETANSAYLVDGSSYNQYIDETVTSVGEWTLDGAVRPSVNLHTSGINAYVVQSSDDEIHMRVATNNDSSVYVNAHTDGDTLDIEVCPPNVIFDGTIDFGKIFWLDDIFHGSPNTEVIIAFPKLIYDELNIEHGSGTLMVDGFNAKSNDFDIGSGRFEFSKSEQFTADFFSVNVGSGTSIISNMQTRRYKIDLGSGHYDFNGLSGYGEIDMGSGSGSIAYSRFMGSEYDDSGDSCNLNIGSGSLDLFFPDDEGCYLYTDIGSGSVNVNAYGVEKKLKQGSDAEGLVLGDANRYYYIDMGSGRVNIYNTSEYTWPTMFENRPDFVDSLRITGIVISTESGDTIYSTASSINAAVQVMTEDTSMAEVTAVPDDNGNASGSYTYYYIGSDPVDELPSVPEAPTAPLAPEAPEAPEPPEAPNPPKVVDAPDF
ncbi:MAG: DUF4097 domain-containing protein [Ruminococcaceae bacterium]|nr:DUF4097 domain-containing protein [Oscillospiraceae bacterium]